MNKPAPKEPSMDEILSSIRQIIADDDAGARKPNLPAASMAPPVLQPEPEEEPAPLDLSEMEMLDEPGDDEPVALSADAILRDEDPEVDEPLLAPPDDPYADADLVDGDDITFELEQQLAAKSEAPAPVTPARPAPPPIQIPVATAAPMPDPTLSSDIAEQLLEPATKAAVKHTFARLGTLALSSPTMTVEDMMRDMLRPMLKEWLDENLPAVVERMVEKEIERISRGTR